MASATACALGLRTPIYAGYALGCGDHGPVGDLVTTEVGQVLLGLFVIVMTWRPHWFRLAQWKAWFSGALTGGLTMLFGATGPLVMSVLPKHDWDKRQIVGTHGMVMTFQHGFKLAAFWVLGFNPIEWGWAIVFIAAGAVVGNLLGARLLGKLPEARFKTSLDILLTLLAVRMLWQGLT